MTCSRYALVAGVVALLAGPAWGYYAYVGSGDEFAKVLVEFGDGAIYAFGVSFADPSTTGIGLMEIIKGETTLTVEIIPDPLYGDYIDKISYKEHSNSGYGGGELYWHYWTKEAADNWVWSEIGASSRIATDGCADAWVYGHSNTPRLPGDATSDLVVDGGDLAVVGGNWIGTGKSWSQGDFTGDGIVDGGDLALLGGNWTFGEPPGPAPLPEPTTAVLLATAAGLLRRRRS